jgi:hypothetical protein
MDHLPIGDKLTGVRDRGAREGSSMDFPFVPKKLVAVSSGIIEGNQKQPGFPKLAKTLLHPETLVFVVKHNDLNNMMRGSVACLKISIACFVACAISFGLAVAISWWMIVPTLALFAAGCYFNAQSNKMQLTLGAILLTLEMMADNFAGLANLLPSECERAREAIEMYFPHSKTRLMDLYFPRRAEVGTQEFAALLQAHASHLFGAESQAALSA